MEAERGIYSFYEDYKSNIYNLTAIPAKGLKVSELPDEVQEFLQNLLLKEIVFSETESIDVRRFFACAEMEY